MTKEWQEASEEYLKVRSLNLMSSKFHYPTHIFDLLIILTGARNGAYHWIQGYAGPEQTWSQGSI